MNIPFTYEGKLIQMNIPFVGMIPFENKFYDIIETLIMLDMINVMENK